MSKLVDSIRAAQATVSTAFDQLAEDVAAEESDEGEPANPAVEKVTVTYSDGTSVDFSPPSEDVPSEVVGAPKSDDKTPQADQASGQGDPGNSEQV